MPSEQFNDQQRREFGLPLLGAAGSSGIATPVLVLDIGQGFGFQYKLQSAVFVGEPINPPSPGADVTLTLIQDGASGNFAVTWAGCWRDAPNWSAGGALATRATARFVYDGLSYQYVGGSSAFAVSNQNIVASTGGMNFASDISGILTNPAPTVAAVTFAGVAPTVTNRAAIVVISPTVGATTLAGVASSMGLGITPPPQAPQFSLALVGAAPVRTP
jgi:hypothetical protein